ncbi:MAG: MmcQ/YjbR family DNA-binding protein [Steroidobacteraceae bacterium]|nr:MmcQ/YjbR family DNA-binding protein [Steroidobacteraceae bacterium]
MARDIASAVREICLSFPQAEQFLSHGSPNFRVRGKTFASYIVNHHGDGRIALWLNSPAGAQDFHTRDEPRYFFVPPYVGPRGWLGVQLDKGLAWPRVAALVRDAYVKVAPKSLTAQLGRTIEITPPTRVPDASARNPLLAPAARRTIDRLRALCLALPEVVEGEQFGHPVWRAGKRSFAAAYDHGRGLRFAFWVGVDRQGLLATDERYSIPMYLGHVGWIELDVLKGCVERELRALALDSYRHFALKRMLAAL